MNFFTIILTVLSLFASFLSSCKPSFNAKDKIFHAAGAGGGIGGIYFALYKNNKYQICESGGIAENCYNGDYIINGDTIVLKNLSKACYIKYNRLLICRYNNQDSSYWQWKYPKFPGQWDKMRWRDLAMDKIGDVHQIDYNNKLVLDPTYYFVIILDSLTYVR